MKSDILQFRPKDSRTETERKSIVKIGYASHRQILFPAINFYDVLGKLLTSDAKLSDPFRMAAHKDFQK